MVIGKRLLDYANQVLGQAPGVN